MKPGEARCDASHNHLLSLIRPSPRPPGERFGTAEERRRAGGMQLIGEASRSRQGKTRVRKRSETRIHHGWVVASVVLAVLVRAGRAVKSPGALESDDPVTLRYPSFQHRRIASGLLVRDAACACCGRRLRPRGTASCSPALCSPCALAGCSGVASHLYCNAARRPVPHCREAGPHPHWRPAVHHGGP